MARLLSPAAFSILTWNLYFAPYQWATRMRHILAECERLQPDVLCFQEVLPPFLALLQEEQKATAGTTSGSTSSTNGSNRNSWLARNDYVSSTLDPQAVAPYGVLTLAKRKHHPCFQSLDLPSRMGRQLLLTHLGSGGGERGGEGGEGVDAGNGEWTIGNVHLESLDSAAVRAEQLRKTGVIFSGEQEREKNVVLCGDFK
jgi:endonuclease/exonuclease/phosphatase family metal-dependent hydrolase